MLSFLQNILPGWKKVAGVEIVQLNEGLEIYACVIENRNNKLNLTSYSSRLAGFKALREFLKEDMPMAVVVSGRGVLSKKLDKTSETEISALVQQAIPNVKAADFYVQVSENSTARHLALIRRNTLDPLIKELGEEKLTVVSLSLGGIVLASLSPLLGDNFSITSPYHSVALQNGLLTSCNFHASPEKQSTSVNIAADTIPSVIAVAYAAAFQIFLPDQINAEVPVTAINKTEWLEKEKFTVYGWTALLFFLTVLIINYLVFSSLAQETSRFALATTLHKTQLEQLEKLKREVGDKDVFFRNTGWLESTKASYYADRLAAILPQSVVLSTIEINPLDEKTSREARKQVFTEGFIVITGQSRRPIDLNGWIRRIKDLPWVKKVNVQNYNYDSEEQAGNFKVEVSY